MQAENILAFHVNFQPFLVSFLQLPQIFDEYFAQNTNFFYPQICSSFGNFRQKPSHRKKKLFLEFICIILELESTKIHKV